MKPIDYSNRETKEFLYEAFTGYDNLANAKLMETIKLKNKYNLRNGVT